LYAVITIVFEQLLVNWVAQLSKFMRQIFTAVKINDVLGYDTMYAYYYSKGTGGFHP
jgi:hypothetical protein